MVASGDFIRRLAIFIVVVLLGGHTGFLSQAFEFSLLSSSSSIDFDGLKLGRCRNIERGD
jgi:hypothetical protein